MDCEYAVDAKYSTGQVFNANVVIDKNERMRRECSVNIQSENCNLRINVMGSESTKPIVGDEAANDFIIGFETMDKFKFRKAKRCFIMRRSTDIKNLFNNISLHSMRQIISYLTITEYLFAILRVCKRWNYDFDPIRAENRRLFEIIINSCLQYRQSSDSMHSTLTQLRVAAFLLQSQQQSVSKQYQQFRNKDPNKNAIAQLRGCDYDYIRNTYRDYVRFCNGKRKLKTPNKTGNYSFLLQFWQLCHYGNKNQETMDRLFLMIVHICCTDNGLLFGLAMDLFFVEYTFTYNKFGRKVGFHHNTHLWEQFVEVVNFNVLHRSLFSAKSFEDYQILREAHVFYHRYMKLCEKYHQPRPFMTFHGFQA